MLVLDYNDPKFLVKLKAALGLTGPGPFELNVATPQFERTDGVLPCDVGPYTFHMLAEISSDHRRALGMMDWGEPDNNGNVLWLFPHEWFNKIPNGMNLENIGGKSFAFDHRTTNNDIRYGMLSFGIRAAA